nr:MAG TPA: hypothetical protein [Caudoviricetes sp.]
MLNMQTDGLLGNIEGFRSLGKAAAGDNFQKTVDIRHVHKNHISFLVNMLLQNLLYKYLLEESTNKIMLFFCNRV